MDGWKLRELLRAGPMVADGAMGTSLMDTGAPLGICFDELSVDEPERVLSVHRGFVEAGAAFVTTNTFGANRYRLRPFANERRVGELNRAGVALARQAGALVAGSVGPLGVRLAPYGRVQPSDAFAAYLEQMEALAAAGADFLIVETQSDLAEAEQALAAARQAGDIGTVISITVARDDRTLLGESAHEVAARLAQLGADAIGVNCSEGPAQVLRVLRAMRTETGDVPLFAQPNAGLPQQVSGRYLYPATPDYFAKHALAMLDTGVAVVGGCCGTKPAHIAAIAQAVRGRGEASLAAADRRVGGGGPAIEVRPSDVPAPRHDEPDTPSELARKLTDGTFVIAVEMDPPKGFSAARMLAGAQTLHEAGADVIDVADAPMARMRMSPWAACRLIEEQAGIETIIHFPTRGRNLLRLQGDLLAVHALGMRNIFVCMGDPVSIGDYPGATDTQDVVPTGLMKLVTQGFNAGSDHRGASIGEPTRFVVGCAVSPNARDLDKEVALLTKKVAAGCSFGLTQPVYSIDAVRQLRAAYEAASGEPLTMPLLVGVLPLVSSRHAEFLHNEVPGIVIPDELRDRLRAAAGGAEATGATHAIDLVRRLQAQGEAGIYLMPPFERFDLAAEVVESARS